MSDKVNAFGLSKADKEFVHDYYKRVTNKFFHPTRCGRCYEDAIIEMYCKYKKDKTMNNENTGFKLRNGAIVHSRIGNGVLSYKNLTDERAIAFIIEFPDLLKSNKFAQVPKNLQELIANYKESKENANAKLIDLSDSEEKEAVIVLSDEETTVNKPRRGRKKGSKNKQNK